MKQWKVNEAGSVVFSDGKIDQVEDRESIIQSIRLGLYCWKRSKFDDPNFGVDWEKIFRNSDGLPIDDLLTMEINAFFVSGFDPRVEKLTFMEISLNNRDVYITGDVVSASGDRFTLEEVIRIK
jgi:hypothetical protein